MTTTDHVTPAGTTATSAAPRHAGWGDGLLGVVIFSGSLPATRAAVAGLSPVFLTSARAAIAGLLGLALLRLLRQPRPARADLRSLAITALGVVLGFPWLTALALEHITAARSVVFIGLLPLATALFGVLRGGERPRPVFWLFALAGSALVAGFALLAGPAGDAAAVDGAVAGPGTATGLGIAAGAGLATGSRTLGDLLMVAAVLVCGLGYAEGATLSRRLGGWQVISWALVLSLPVMAPVAIASRPASPATVAWPAWLGLGYVALFSMLIGFVFWYRGLARGGIARVGQLQLLQPFLGLALSAGLLGEAVSPAMGLATAGVVLCVAAAKRFG